MLKCSLCEQLFERIPAHAIQVGKARGNKCLFRFPDGSVHELYRTGMGAKKKPKKQVPVQQPKGIRTVAVYVSSEEKK